MFLVYIEKYIKKKEKEQQQMLSSPDCIKTNSKI